MKGKKLRLRPFSSVQDSWISLVLHSLFSASAKESPAYGLLKQKDCGADQSIPLFREDPWNRKAKTDLSKQIYSKSFPIRIYSKSILGRYETLS